MPAQILLESVHGPSTTSFTLHTAQEIGRIALQQRAAGKQTLVFVHRTATQRFLVAGLRTLGLTVEGLHAGLDPDQRHGVINQFGLGELDVVVATDALATGWRTGAGCDQVLHHELPPFNGAFANAMAQREARILSFLN